MIKQRNNINYKTFRQKVLGKFAGFKKTSYLCTAFEEKALQYVRDLAQLVAHTSGGREVAGSSPVIPTKRKSKPLIISSLDFFYALNWRGFGVIFIFWRSLSPDFAVCNLRVCR